MPASNILQDIPSIAMATFGREMDGKGWEKKNLGGSARKYGTLVINVFPSLTNETVMVVKQYDPPSPLLHRGSDKGGGVVQRILIGTRHKASGLQIQNWMHGPIFATTKYRAQLDLIPKTVQDMHCKSLCI